MSGLLISAKSAEKPGVVILRKAAYDWLIINMNYNLLFYLKKNLLCAFS